MKPIAIFQHFPGDGPGHFELFATQNALPIQVFRGDLGAPLPESIAGFSAMVSMGGPMSVNEHRDFIEHEARLMEQALALDIPILGHCLGSQLLARALGARISANRPESWEIGWHPVQSTQSGHEDWTAGFDSGDEVFHWHNENFSLPDGATRLLDNPNCSNQAFVHGIHLGMQFHIEITAAMVENWCANSQDPQNWQHLPAVQSAEEMQRDLSARVQRSRRMALQVYRRWSRALPEKEKQ
jgi:GMP synthase-like glutamine amidotransferase